MADTQIRSDAFLAFVSDKDTVELVKSLALSRYGLKVEVQQGNIKTATSYLQANSSPRVLLIDITGSEFPLTDMKALAEVCEPGVQVIAIGERNDVGIFRDLVELGVKDYIAKPLNITLLIRSIETLMSGPGAAKKSQGGFNTAGKLVSFLGSHGGVGSSTLAANCSWALAHLHHKRVCMMDLDFHYGIMNQIFNIEPSSGLRDILVSPDRIDEEVLMRSVIKVSEYLSTLSAPMAIDERFEFPTKAIESCVAIPLELCHYTVLDLPLYDHAAHYPLLAQSNVIVLTLDFTLISVKDAVSLLRVLKTTQDVQIIVVANKQGEYKKGELDRKMFEESIGQEIDVVIPFDALKPLQNLNEGIPVASEKGILSDGICDITTLITGKQAAKTPQGSSFLSGFFGGNKTVA